MLPPVKKLHLITFAAGLPMLAQAASLEVRAVNPLPLARASQTLELSAADLAPLAAKDLATIHVKDASGTDLLCQAIDHDGDPLRKPDAVIFQADFAAGETKTFTVTTGPVRRFSKEQFKSYGRFNRERFDDFVWENDRIAHRTYGKALETWQGEPLTSSTIDIWSKRTPRMVVNEWYMTDDYHADHGEGADLYSAGPSRGCGGSGLWADGKLWVSKNFVNSRVLANGPIRVMFELEYDPYEVNGHMVSEIKRVTLDAGQQFNRYQSRYCSEAAAQPATAVGLKKAPGEILAASPENGWLAKWEPMGKTNGWQGLAVIVPPDAFAQQAEDSLNHLVVMKTADASTVTWWAGFCWDRAGLLTTADQWTRHVDEYARCLAHPIQLHISPTK
jgi:hypothetical protein